MVNNVRVTPGSAAVEIAGSTGGNTIDLTAEADGTLLFSSGTGNLVRMLADGTVEIGLATVKLTIGTNGLLTSSVATYETLVSADDDFITKKYFDDNQTAFDIDALTTATIATGDWVAFADINDTNIEKKTTAANFIADLGILTTADEGPGNGLDADTVDGIQGASLVQTTRNLTAGTGLSGGGTLAADRTFTVALQEFSLDAGATLDPASDWLVFVDATDNTHYRITVDNLLADTSALLSADIGSTVQAWDTDLDTYAANPLTSGELTQLQNINTTTINATQWGYLGSADQGITTTDSVTFVGLTLSSNVTIYEAVNDGNPEIRLGATDAEEFHIQTVYDAAAQTLDYVLFATDAASAVTDKGEFRFQVDGTQIAEINDGGINVASGLGYDVNNASVLTATTLGSSVVNSSLTSVGTLTTLDIAASASLTFNSTAILADAAGTMTLSNIDALDATTEATIEAAIDTLANLTSASALATVGTVTSGTWSATVSGATFTGGINLPASTNLSVNSVNILADSAGTMTLSNVDALDATTEATIEATIDTLANLTSAASLATVGTLNSGSISSGFGNIDIGASTFDTTGAVSVGTLTGAGNVTIYEAVNDGNPEIRLGATDAEELHIQAVYDAVAQTLDYVLFQTDAASVTANKGLFRFNVDGTDILDINDSGIDLDTGGALFIAGTSVLNATTLGTGVVTSSLTTVGALNSGSIASGFGSIDNGTSDITTGGILKVDVDGTAINAAGSLTFGTGNDAAIYWDGGSFVIDTAAASDTAFEVNGTEVATISTTGLQTNNATGGAVLNEAASGTNPTLIPDKSDLTTGIGNDGTDLVLVSGGTEMVTVSTTQVDFNAKEIINFNTAINAQTGTTYTLVAADNGKVITMSNASAITLTLENSLAAGFSCTVIQKGAGQITFTPEAGAARLNRQSHTKSAGQYAVCQLWIESNAGTAAQYYLSGDTAA